MTETLFLAPKTSYFSEGRSTNKAIGQFWGGTLYNWDKHEAPREYVGGAPNLMGDFLEEVTFKTVPSKSFSN